MAKVTVCDISGMGGREAGGYEWGCQIICARTAKFLSDREGKEYPRFMGYKGIVGVISADNKAAQELDDYILAHPKLREYGMTGAMHQFGIQHGIKLYELGRQEYLRQLREGRGPEDFYEFDDTDAFPELTAA